MAELAEQVTDGVCVVRLTGVVDVANADEVRDRLLECLSRSEVVEVDLSAITFIDSSGLGALVRLRTEAATLGKQTALLNLSPATERLLELTGLRGLFDVKTTS